jgi:hypothetical protein
MHKPSGLLGVGIFSTSHANPSAFYGKRAPDKTAWDVQAGIDRNFFAPGPTAFWRGYGKVNDGLGQGSNAISAAFPPTAA